MTTSWILLKIIHVPKTSHIENCHFGFWCLFASFLVYHNDWKGSRRSCSARLQVAVTRHLAVLERVNEPFPWLVTSMPSQAITSRPLIGQNVPDPYQISFVNSLSHNYIKILKKSRTYFIILLQLNRPIATNSINYNYNKIDQWLLTLHAKSKTHEHILSLTM